MDLTDKVILLTGGTGSFGKSFVTEALKHDPKSIRIFSRNEYFQYDMQRKFKDERLRFLIGDVRDESRLLIASQGVDIIVHAAAMKHVPMCETHPIEAVKTNILGSINIVNVARINKIGKVLAISSDKAVSPIGVYGATKMAMEKIMLEAHQHGGKYSCLRPGNYETSRGNVVELWEEQKDVITVTDMEMTRYWITLEEVAKFSIRCIEMMEGGEIFIPKMSRKAMRELIQQYAPDAVIKIIGKRRGEKKHEHLFNEDETYKEFDDYYVIRR